MKNYVAIGAALLLSSGPLIAQPALPHTGSCEHKQVISEDFKFRTLIQWQGEDAIISTRGEEIKGRVVGMRPHDVAWKFSIRFEDSIMGESEMVIFQSPGREPPEYRRAIIYYTTLEDGDMVANAVNGFEDITCAVLY